jgi:DNA-binding transcriptional MerR regulator
METERPLTTGDVARILGLSPERVRELGDAGIVPFTTTLTGRVRLYDGAAIARVAAERERRRVARGEQQP